MKIYGLETLTLNRYFSSIEELEKFTKLNGIFVYPNNIVKILFLGEYHNRKDVVKKIYASGVTIICAPRTEDTISIYNEDGIWMPKKGTLLEEFKILKSNNIIFENDVYSLNFKKRVKKYIPKSE